jgi:hypothetical protein
MMRVLGGILAVILATAPGSNSPAADTEKDGKVDVWEYHSQNRR